MRLRHLFALGVGAVGVMVALPSAAEGCFFFKKHRPRYVAPCPPPPCPPPCPTYGAPGYGAPVYPAPGYGAPGFGAPGYAAPRGFYGPPSGSYMTPGMVPGTIQPGTTITPMPGVPTGPAPGAPMTSSSVSAKDNVFDPATITVQPGTTVRWVNNGQHPHTVTARDGSFDSGNIPPGGSFTHTFSAAGAVRYYCKLHKGMEGTVVVGEPKKMPAGGGGTPAKGPSY